MKNILRVLCPLVFVIAAVTGAQAQLCGKSFEQINVVDGDEKPVAKAEIELLGAISKEEFQGLWTKYASLDAKADSVRFELPEKVGRDLSKSNLQALPAADYCGNSLNQKAGVTPVKSIDHLRNIRAASTAYFGYCFEEGSNLGYVLVRLSAPGYKTTYFLGFYFYGCRDEVIFELKKKNGR